MSLRNLIITALRALKKNKVRSALTSVGIIIGVSSVIVMIGFGNSARIEVRQKIKTFGANALSVETTAKPFTEADIKLLRETIYQIRYITPYIRKTKVVTRSSTGNMKTEVHGVGTDYFKIRKKVLERGGGRFFTDYEVMSHAKVAVIGKTVHTKLFNNADVLGQTIMLENLPLMVIGVMEETGESFTGSDFDELIVIPYTTAATRLVNERGFSVLDIAAGTESGVDQITNAMTDYMRHRNQIIEGKEDNFRIRSSRDKLKAAEDISRALSILLAGIASISLFVGGVGIMNIMLVSVTERTREIGIRMAIGAKKRDIMLQFLIESVTLSVAGGIVGIILGMSIYGGIVYFVNWPFVISPASIIVSVFFAAGVGVFFGFYPSRRAADLKPIEALKYE